MWTANERNRGEFMYISHRSVTACDACQLCMSSILVVVESWDVEGGVRFMGEGRIVVEGHFKKKNSGS